MFLFFGTFFGLFFFRAERKGEEERAKEIERIYLRNALQQRRAFQCLNSVFQPEVIVLWHIIRHMLKMIAFNWEIEIGAEFHIRHQNNLWTHHKQFTLFNVAQERGLENDDTQTVCLPENLRVCTRPSPNNTHTHTPSIDVNGMFANH